LKATYTATGVSKSDFSVPTSTLQRGHPSRRY